MKRKKVVENCDIVIKEDKSSGLSSIEEEDIGSYESDEDDEAFLARFDDDGHLIG